MEENMDKLLNYIDDLCEENGKLRDKLREAENAGRIKNTKTFLKGLGAGVAITPGAFWLAWRLVELLINCWTPFLTTMGWMRIWTSLSLDVKGEDGNETGLL